MYVEFTCDLMCLLNYMQIFFDQYLNELV